jgi:tRNA pseudouridine55 synthase
LKLYLNMIPDGLYPTYKYRGPSSNQFMSHFKRHNQVAKDAKIGYAGTLDPLAEGILIIAVGRRYTKQLQSESDNDKEYRATIMLNGTTDCGDMEGELIRLNHRTEPTIGQVLEVCECFEGAQMQVPSSYSAKKIDGRKSYDMVRSGGSKEGKSLDACPITIHSIQVLEYNYPSLEIEVNCTKGTFIRVLGQEIGKKLTGGGYLSKLVRTMSGIYGVEDIEWKLSPKPT